MAIVFRAILLALIASPLVVNSLVYRVRCHEHYDRNRDKFIPIASVCDGVQDCRNYVDERHCYRDQWPDCGKGRFNCQVVKNCVPYYAVCNGRDDCQDGSDEEYCYEPRYPTCDHALKPWKDRAGRFGSEQAHMFTCKNNKCIRYSYVCDGDDDCGDLSDEQNCRNTTGADQCFYFDPTCPEHCMSNYDCPYCACPGGRGTAIKDKEGCAAFDTTCPVGCVGVDSNGCLLCKCPAINVTKNECPENKYRCKSGECIDASLVCDLKADCADKSDEKQCGDLCTDFVSLEETPVQYIDKVIGKTADQAYFTNILLRDTMDSTDPSIYRIKQEGDCGSCSKCTVWERFKSYEDFQNNRPFDNGPINPNIACYANTVRIYGGYVYCHTANFTDYTSKDPRSYMRSHMVKMNATDGSVVAKKSFQMAYGINTCIEDFYKQQETVIDYLIDRTGFWVLYRPYNYNFILQQIDPDDLSFIRKIPIDIQSITGILSLTSPIIMMCGKCYYFQFDSNMVKVKMVFDISNPSTKFNAETTLTKNPLYPFRNNLRPAVHFNPLSNELFLHNVNLNHDVEEYADFSGPLSMNFRVPIVSCNTKFNSDFLSIIKSTILWSLHQTGEHQMNQRLEILTQVLNMDDMDTLSKISDIFTNCHNPNCNNPLYASSSPCVIRQIISHIKIYADKMKPSKPDASVMLEVSQDQRELLRQQTLRSISNKIEQQLKVLQNQTTFGLLNNLKVMKDILPDYFASLATFDQAKAKADVDFLQSRLNSYQASIGKDGDKVGRTLEVYFKAALTSTSAELAEKIARLGLAIASMFKPAKLLGGGNALEIVDALADVAEATTKLTRVVKSKETIRKIAVEYGVLTAQMNKALQTQRHIRFMFVIAVDNKLQQESAERYMTGFLQEYTSYDPVFTKGAFANIGALLSETIDDLCGLIFEGGSTASNIAQTIFVTDHGSCINAKTDIQRLLATFDELYDFQFDLMEAMAEFAKATVSMRTAREISSSISQKITEAEQTQHKKTQEFSVRLYSLQLIAANKAHIGTLVRDACNLIEYKRAGKPIEFCKNLRLTSDPTSTSYDALVAYNYAKNMCSDDFSIRVIDIPAAVSENGAGITHPYTIDLERLYKGEEVSFQVPDSSWLTRNRWMNAVDANKANFIRSFELFIPPMFSRDQPYAEDSEVHISVEMIGDNQIIPLKGNKKYSFSSSTIYNHRYTDSHRCYKQARPITNPYDTRDCRPLQQPCITSPGTMAAAVYHPSIYSRWKIRLVNSGGRLRPNPSGEFFLKAGVTICHVDPSVISVATLSLPQTIRGGQCCADQGKVYDKFGVCQPCPSNSCVQLNGYYCHRNCTSPP